MPRRVTGDGRHPKIFTGAELAEKPSKAYLWGVLAALIATYGCGLAGLAILLH